MSSAADSAVPSLIEQVITDIQEDRLELPGFPEAVLRIQRTLQFPDAEVDDIVRIISSEPALAAQALRIANSVIFRLRDGEVTDLRTAVNRLGFNLIRSIAVAFAIQQLRLGETYSPAARAEIETIWRDSLNTASICFVLAKHCTQVNADQALLAGLLHVLGRLYFVTRGAADGADRTEGADDVGAEDTDDPNGAAGTEPLQTASAWHAAVGAALLREWGLSERLQHAVEHQDDLNYDGGAVTLTDVLIAAKLLATGTATNPADSPVLQRISGVRNKNPISALAEHDEEIRALRRSLGA